MIKETTHAQLCRQLFFQKKTLRKLEKPYQPIVPKTLGDHIMNRRKILGLLQKDIAPMLGVGEACISLWESRGGTIRTVYFPRIAQFLGYEWWQFDTSTLGGRIQDYRYRNGLRAEDFAKLVGIEYTAVRRWERGMNKPPKEMVKKLNALLENTQPL